MLLVNMVFADIPLDKNGNNKTAISDLNYLPWILGVLFAIGIFAFLHTLKKEKNETK
jgi:predicted outer membrane lipoprotein